MPSTRSTSLADALKISERSTLELLRAYAAILDALAARGVLRTKNNPVADYCEWLVSTKLSLRLENNSRSGHDALGPDGTRYQIKSRRVTPNNKSVQLSAIRGLDRHNFDCLIGVIFEADFSIRYAAQVPHEVVAERATFREHTNAHVFHLRRTIFEDHRVSDITARLR